MGKSDIVWGKAMAMLSEAVIALIFAHVCMQDIDHIINAYIPNGQLSVPLNCRALSNLLLVIACHTFKLDITTVVGFYCLIAPSQLL